MQHSIDKFSKDNLEVLDQCPYCHKDQTLSLFAENGFQYLQCRDCTLIFLETRLKEDRLDLIYGDASYHQVDNPDYYHLIGKKRLALFDPLPPRARIHEDGAGNGAFIRACLDAGLNATGSDLGLDSIRKAKQHFQVKLQHGPIEALDLENGSLQAFASFNLLCHLYRPWDYLQTVSDLLQKDGQLLIRTGNRAGFFKHFQQGHWGAPEHVYHFNLRILDEWLSKVDLKIEQVQPAFDSDFPYLFYDYSRTGETWSHQLARRICRESIRFWNLFKLPKEDVYILATKT